MFKIIDNELYVSADFTEIFSDFYNSLDYSDKETKAYVVKSVNWCIDNSIKLTSKNWRNILWVVVLCVAYNKKLLEPLYKVLSNEKQCKKFLKTDIYFMDDLESFLAQINGEKLPKSKELPPATLNKILQLAKKQDLSQSIKFVLIEDGLIAEHLYTKYYDSERYSKLYAAIRSHLNYQEKIKF